MFKLEFIPETKYSYKMLSMQFIAAAGIFLSLNEFASEIQEIITDMGVEYVIPQWIFLRLSQVSLVCAGLGRLLKQKKLEEMINSVLNPDPEKIAAIEEKFEKKNEE